MNPEISAARVEISDETRYAHAGAYVDETPPIDPARVKILVVVQDGPPTDPAEGADETAGGAEGSSETRPPYFPLRRRGRNLRDAGHAAYYDAETPAAGLGAAYDYARAACTRAAKAGMPVPAAEDTLIDIGRALMAVGDSVTADMHTWRPGR